VKTNCFNVQINSPIADVIKNQNRHRSEIKNNVACDVISQCSSKTLQIQKKIMCFLFFSTNKIIA